MKNIKKKQVSIILNIKLVVEYVIQINKGIRIHDDVSVKIQ